MKKKVFALVLTLAMLAAILTVPAMAASGKTFPDAEGHWAEESILRWSRAGLVKGDELGNVNPNKPLRRCEMATILSDMLGLRTAAPISTFTDIDGTEWYARAILRCAAAGIMEGRNDSTSDPESYITREEAITMFCRALGVPRDDDPDLSAFSDGDQVSGWAAPYMATLTKLGILSGMGDGTIAPHDDINRAGSFTLMDKAISVYANAPGVYNSKNANGFVVINANTHQTGDVVVTGKAVGVLVPVGATDNICLRDLSAEYVTVNGKSNVVIEGASSLDNVALNTEISVTVRAGATVDTLDMNTEKLTVTNAGTVKEMNCKKVATVTNSGKVEKLVAGAVASITNTGTVDKLVANAGITVDNAKGTVKDAEINIGGVIMDGPPQQMTLADGVVRPTNSSGRPITASGAVSAPSNSGKTPSSNPPKPSTKPVTGVTLNHTSWSLKVGDATQGTLTLTATVTPSDASNKNVTWESSNTAVATVDSNGVVTAVGAGEATIEAFSNNNIKATCQITVRAADDESPVAVSGVSLNETTLELDLEGNKTAQLTATVAPGNADNKKVTWESSDPETVSVSDTGLVTAMQASSESVTITVTTEDGEKKATCQVTVRKATQEEKPVTGLTLTPSELILKMGETISGTVKAEVEPADATDAKVEWTVTKGSDVIEISGTETNTITVTAQKNGSATITATAGGETATCDVTVEPADLEIVIDPVPTLTVDGETNSATLSIKVNGVAPTEEMDVEWSIESGDSVTLEGNKVTAKGVGKTTIQVTVTIENKPHTAQTVVEVTDGETTSVPQVNGVTINVAPSEEIEVGTTVTLSVTVDADEGANTAVTWTVTVEEGNESDFSISDDLHASSITVTATQPGRVTIKVASDEKPEVSTTRIITFKQSPLTVKAVDINKTGGLSLKIENGEGTEGELTATVTMSDDNPDATQTVTWSVTQEDNTEFAAGEAVVMITPDTEDSQKVTVKALKPGKAKVIASCGGQSGHCIVTVEEVKPEYDLAVTVNNGEESGITLTASENGEGQVVISVTIDEESEGTDIVWAATDTSDQDADGMIVNLTPGAGNSCTVEAITEGTVTITVTYGALSVTCTVIITEKT